MYKLKKWYFDFLTPEHDFVFVYFACVQLFGRSMRSLTIHVARPRTEFSTTRSFTPDDHEERTDGGFRRLIKLPGGKISFDERSCSILYAGKGCSLDLQYAGDGASLTNPVMIETGGRSHVLWQPLRLRYAVSGTVSAGGQQLTVKNSSGYGDFLESTYLPPVVPVRTLFWGRLHHPGLDLVYIHAAPRSSQRNWSRLIVRSDGALAEMNNIKILPADDSLHAASERVPPPSYEVVGENSTGRIRLKIHHILPVQESSFIDQQEIASPVARSILRLLTRNPRSTKFLSRADLVLETGKTQKVETNIPMIDEYALL